MAVGVYDCRFAVYAHALLVLVIKMDVPVNHECGLASFDEIRKAHKSAMAWIVLVMYVARRCVREENVEKCSVAQFVPKKFRREKQKARRHFEFRILAQSVIVVHAARNACEQERAHFFRALVHYKKAFVGEAFEARVDCAVPVRSLGGNGIRITYCGRIFVIIFVFFQIVISKNEICGLVQRGHDEINVVHRKVARAQNCVNVAENFFDRRVVDERIDFV